jgi:hypothetical protein
LTGRQQHSSVLDVKALQRAGREKRSRVLGAVKSASTCWREKHSNVLGVKRSRVLRRESTLLASFNAG